MNPADLERTTIVINRKTVRRLEELGSHADTFDNILNRLIDYDIKLHGPGPQHKTQGQNHGEKYDDLVTRLIDQYIAGRH